MDKALGNGGTYTVVNKRPIMRDTAGRIYQERWFLVPKNGKSESTMSTIQIADPIEHTLYNCMVGAKRCYLTTWGGSTKTVYRPEIGPSGPLPDGTGDRTSQDPGTSNLNGINTVGYREITTINTGVAGNDQPMVTSREFWYAPQLGINLVSKLDSPDTGKQEFLVTEISASEPEPQKFIIPEGYAIVDRREAAPGH